MRSSETLDRICNKLEIYQAVKGYRFGLESVLLAWFVQKGAENLVDLGCGSGVISLLLTGFNRVGKAVGIEIQADLAKRAARSVVHNQLTHCVDIIQADLKNLSSVLSAGAYDAVVCNPPFRPAKTGNISEQPEKAFGKHEILCSLKDVVASASRLLKPKGRFNAVLPPQRLPEILGLCKEHRLNPSRLRMIHGRKELMAKNCLLEAVRSGRGSMKVEPPMIVYDNSSSYTEEVKAMLYP